MGTPAVAPVKNKLNVVYLKGKGYAHQEIADGVWVDEDTVTEKVRKLQDGVLPGLLAEHFRQGKG